MEIALSLAIRLGLTAIFCSFSGAASGLSCGLVFCRVFRPGMRVLQL